MKRFAFFALIAAAALSLGSCLNDSEAVAQNVTSVIDNDIPLTVKRYYETTTDSGSDDAGADAGGDDVEDSRSGDDSSSENINTSFPALTTTTYDYIIVTSLTNVSIKNITLIGENSSKFTLTRHEENTWRFSVSTNSTNETDSPIIGTVYITANNVSGGLSYNVMQLCPSSRPTARYILFTTANNSTQTVGWDEIGEGNEQTLIATVHNGSQSELKTLKMSDSNNGLFEVIGTPDVATGKIVVRATTENKTGKDRSATIFAALDENSDVTYGEYIFATTSFTQEFYIAPVTPPSFTSIDTSTVDFPIGYQAGDRFTRQITINPGGYTIVASQLDYKSNEGYTISFSRVNSTTFNATITATDLAATYVNNVFSETPIYINYTDEHGDAQQIKSDDHLSIKFHVND